MVSRENNLLKNIDKNNERKNLTTHFPWKKRNTENKSINEKDSPSWV